MKYILAPLLLSCMLIQNGLSQDLSRTNPENELWVGIWTAYSPFSTPFLAKMQNTRLAMGGIEIRYAEIPAGRKTVHLSGEVILLGWAGYPKNGISGPRESRLGIGAVPFRFSLPVLRKKNNYLHLDTGLGMFFFDDRFPGSKGAFLNATVDVGIGYTFRLSGSTELGFSYRFHHLSNGGRAIVNPGVDSNLIVISLRTRS